MAPTFHGGVRAVEGIGATNQPGRILFGLPVSRRVHLGVWQRFRAKPAAEQRAALSAFAVGPLVKVMLRTRGYAATVRLLEGFQRSPSPGNSEGRARAAGSAMQRLPFPMTCLDRSLVVWWLLGGAPDAVIRFGVAPGSGGEAPRFHAWVVADGMALDFDTENLDTFLPLETPPAI